MFSIKPCFTTAASLRFSLLPGYFPPWSGAGFGKVWMGASRRHWADAPLLSSVRGSEHLPWGLGPLIPTPPHVGSWHTPAAPTC